MLRSDPPVTIPWIQRSRCAGLSGRDGWNAHLILIGLAGLADRLALRKNRSLLSRHHTGLRIEPLLPSGTTEYLCRRLRRAVSDRDLFDSDALAFLHQATQGAMRDLDRLATHVLQLAAAKKRRLIDRVIVSQAVSIETQDPAE